MRAAAAGKSTLGIPKSVGKGFVRADKVGGAAGRKPLKKPSKTPGGVA